jgi:hypothetical protein
MNQVALVAGFMPHCERHGGVSRPCFGIDLASIRSAPFEKFVDTYIDLFGKAAGLLKISNGCFDPFKPSDHSRAGIRDRWRANAANPLCGAKLPQLP